MFSLTSSLEYYLYRAPTDMRKSFDSLCGIVSGQLGRDPMSGEAFIFINKPRNKIKLLHWEHGGFVLYYKRLESGTIELPAIKGTDHGARLDWAVLVMMIDGIKLGNMQKRKRYARAQKKR